MKLNRKRLLTEQRTGNNDTQARSEEETPQIQKSLRKHNRGKENNKQHEKTQTTDTREEQQQRGRNKATLTRSSTLPPPEGEWSFVWGSSPRHERDTKTEKQQQRGEAGPSTNRDRLYTAF